MPFKRCTLYVARVFYFGFLQQRIIRLSSCWTCGSSSANSSRSGPAKRTLISRRCRTSRRQWSPVGGRRRSRGRGSQVTSSSTSGRPVKTSNNTTAQVSRSNEWAGGRTDRRTEERTNIQTEGQTIGRKSEKTDLLVDENTRGSVYL